MVVKFFFLISILLDVKIFLTIFIYENKLFMFYVLLFWSNQHFALRLQSHF